ncbi:MAG: putative ABC-type ATPase [Thalassolituus oleivorans]|jgi:predicted ABC-type ATPase
MKQLWMLVGGNGSGKSTFYEQMLKPKGMPFINADIIAKEAFPDDPVNNSHKAARIAEELRFDKLRQGYSFCFETVFSHVSKIDFIATAKATGYQVILVFIHIDNTDLNQVRVAQRVLDGGHNVPADKILSRIPRTLDNVKAAIPLCDEVHVLDNSRLDDPFKRVLSIINGQISARVDAALPSWVLALIGE